MSRRIYVKGKKTHAKDQNFKQDNVGGEKERFFVSIELVSLKTLKDYDLLGVVGEFYFKIDGGKLFKSRFPDKGEIKLQKNQSFTSKADLSLWSQFITVRTGKKSTVEIEVILREMDHLKKDTTIASKKFEIKLPSKTAYIILDDEDENTKAKLRIQASKTRY